MSVQQPVFEEIIVQVEQLSLADQLRVISRLTERLASLVQQRSSNRQMDISSGYTIPEISRHSVVDILAVAQGHRLFKTMEDVEQYIAEERATWDN